MAKRRKSNMFALSMKNPLVMYGLYGTLAYVGYQWWMGRPIVIPFMGQQSVNAYPTEYLP